MYLSLINHLGLKTQLDDLGNMSQPLWNTLNGRFMEMSNTGPLPFERMHRFAGHTNFIFLFLVPLYALWSDPRLLLIIQVLMASLGAMPLYLLGRKLLGEKSWLVLVGPVLYLLNPILHDAVLYDMHAIVVALPFLLFSIYFLEAKNYRLFALCAVLLALSKEDMPLIIAMLGIWHFVRTRDWKVSSIITSSGLIFFGFLIFIAMPFFRQNMPEQLISQRYEHVGGSVPGMILTSLTRPQVLLTDMLAKGLLSYLHWMLLGFSYLPMLSPLSLAIVPTVLINMLSGNPINSMPFGYYYPAPIIAIFSASTIYGLRRWKDQPLIKELSVKYLSVLVIVVAVVFSFWTSPVPFSKVSSWQEFQPDPRWNEINYIKTLIPEEASLAVQNNLGPHFVNREAIVRFPYRSSTSDYVLVDVTDPYPVLRDKPRQRNFIHITQLYPQDYYDSVIQVLEDTNYGVVYAGDGFLLFQRDASRELNTAAYYTLKDRAKYYFTPYESIVGPVNYYLPSYLN